MPNHRLPRFGPGTGISFRHGQGDGLVAHRGQRWQNHLCTSCGYVGSPGRPSNRWLQWERPDPLPRVPVTLG